jgi:Zn-dependent protease with chaperone function
MISVAISSGGSSEPSFRLNKQQINELIKSKEKIYFALSAIIGALIWFGLIYAIVFREGWGRIVTLGLLYGVGALVAFWLISSILRTYFFGNCVLVSSDQFPIVQNLILESTQALGMQKPPYVFILHGRGILNAFAMKVLRTRYVVLHAEVVDFALKRGKQEELRFIITHELAHHVLGHLSLWRHYLILPAVITLFLPMALSRAREYSCDIIAAKLIANQQASAYALMMLAHGSLVLANEADVRSFVEQEDQVPVVGGFLVEIFSSHPRLTRRVINVLVG